LSSPKVSKLEACLWSIADSATDDWPDRTKKKKGKKEKELKIKIF